jgi:hypothetical protein
MDAGIIANFKVKYRAFHLQHLVDKYDECQTLQKINVRQAIDFLVRAWDNVQPQTIANCWQSTGLLVDPSAEIEHELERLTKAMEVQVRVLISELPSLSEPMSVEAYLNAEVELGVQTTRGWTDDEIVHMVTGKDEEEHIDSDDDQDDNDNLVPVPEPWSTSKLLEGLDQLAMYWQNQGGDEDKDQKAVHNYKITLDMIEDINFIRRNAKKQTQITNYFMPNS